MDIKKQSLTALVSCFAKFFHTTHSIKPIFQDNIAGSILSEEEKKLIANHWTKAISFYDKEKSEIFKNDFAKLEWVMNTQCVPQLVSRARYAEDGLLSAIKRGVRQYIILGAGYDTFAYRQENLPDDFMIYEVDHPDTQKTKIQRLMEKGIQIPDNVQFVPVNFQYESLSNRLLEAGYDQKKYSYFSLLGVSMYLDKKDFYHLLSSIAKISLPGSSFVFDYLDHTAFNNEIASKKLIQMMQVASQAGERIVSGFDPLEIDIELQNNNMLVYENLSPLNIEEMYFENRNDQLHAFDHFHFAHLAVAK